MAAKRVLYACAGFNTTRCAATTENQAMTIAAAEATRRINALPIALRLGLRVNITARSFALMGNDSALEGTGDIISASSRQIVIMNTYTADGF